MNKIVRFSITVACILAIATIGFVNAEPKLLKQCNMVYWTSADPTPYGVSGNQVSDFKLTLNGNSDPNFWYYLNIKFIKPDLPSGVYMFYLAPPPATDTAFWNYWAAKDVTLAHFLAHVSDNPLTWPWQSWMWLIIHGTTLPGGGFYQVPMFGLRSDGAGNYELRDGLTQYASHATAHSPLRLNGDYPLGTYAFTCKGATELTPPYPDLAVNVLDDVVMTIQFR